MEALLDAIRIALREGASDAERHDAAASCRALAEMLEPTPLVFPHPPEAVSTTRDPGDTLTELIRAARTGPFASMTADQILDLAIAKLQAAAGPLDPDAVGRGFQMALVPIPRLP
jgi:hypothetical protein